uniref:Uncharacterized protein n=1 Tax=Hemiselmis andersenii TaxID=464988 RepID=A0A7S1DW83_HEMAN|mmetsp:Transcript_2684/g.6314  ORF Transcript_2684/g.6314 Transcript_2684/m.6314 type:complete len:176 (+) Transcript_2684:65-592(+)
MSNSAKAAQSCHRSEMGQLQLLCDSHLRMEQTINASRWALTVTKKKLLKEVRGTVYRLQALQAFSSINVHGFCSICKSFDERAGTCIACAVMDKCVAELDFSRDTGVYAASRHTLCAPGFACSSYDTAFMNPNSLTQDSTPRILSLINAMNGVIDRIQARECVCAGERAGGVGRR